MGFNKRKMEDRRRKAAEQEAAARRALGPQIIEDSVKLIEVWNARQAAHMPMLFSPTIEAAITAGYWFLRTRSVMQILPAECPVRRARMPIQEQRRRRFLCGIQRQQVGTRMNVDSRREFTLLTRRFEVSPTLRPFQQPGADL
jgi:hypothetical protein